MLEQSIETEGGARGIVTLRARQKFLRRAIASRVIYIFKFLYNTIFFLRHNKTAGVSHQYHGFVS